jgi:ABC-type cobalamin transport system permease subunit
VSLWIEVNDNSELRAMIIELCTAQDWIVPEQCQNVTDLSAVFFAVRNFVWHVRLGATQTRVRTGAKANVRARRDLINER